MTQHGDGDRWISDDQPNSLPSDPDFLNPRAVIDSREQCEIARSQMRLNFVSERVPAVNLGRKLVNRQRFIAYIGEEGCNTSSKPLLLSNLRRTPVKGISRGVESFMVDRFRFLISDG